MDREAFSNLLNLLLKQYIVDTICYNRNKQSSGIV